MKGNMSLKNVLIVPRSHTGLPPFGIHQGEAYPIPPPSGMPMVSLESYVDGSTMVMNVCLNTPTSSMLRAFRSSIRLALYEGPELRGGLLLFRMTHTRGLLGMVLACPFNPPKHEQARPKTLDAFYTTSRVALLTILTDTGVVPPVVKGIRLLELPEALRDHLRVLWKDSGAYSNYEKEFCEVVKEKPLHQLWREASKF